MLCAYKATSVLGCYNAPGKTLVCEMCRFLVLAIGPADHGHYQCLCSTASSGATQPGSLLVTWATP